MNNLSFLKKTLLASVGTASLAGSSFAGETATELSAKATLTPVAEEESLFDRLWALPTLYKNPDNFWLQELKIIGRYNGQYAIVDQDLGRSYIWDNRRFRIGASAKFGNIFKAVGQIDIRPRFNPFYRNLDVAYLEMKPSAAFALRAGKIKPLWSREYSTSSKYIETFERSNLVNQIRPFKSTGVSVSGKIDNWSYYAALTSDQLDAEFATFNEGHYIIGSLGYDLSDALPVEKADARLDYLHHTERTEFREPYKHALSASFAAEDGPFGLVTDLIYANGYDNDAWGLVLMPSYEVIEDKLQAVFRYHFAHGENDSMRQAGRYERVSAADFGGAADKGFGENYHSFYAGLNYFIYGDKLKLMTGLEYATLDDPAGDGGGYNGWTWFSGIRIFF